MDRMQAFEELPTAYAVALRMREDGASDRAIATALGVPERSVASLLELAEAKLASMLGPKGSRDLPSAGPG